MRQFSRPLWAILTLCSATAAQAQIASENLSVELNRDVLIGIDDCSTALDDDFILSGTLDGTGSADYELRLTFSETSSPCSWTDLPDCGVNKTVAERRCGCIASSTTATLNKTLTLDDLETIDCAAVEPGVTEIYFFLEYADRSDDEDTTVTSESTTARIDFERPAAPTNAPTVTSAENALQVSFDEVDGDDITRYEVCARANAAAVESLGAGLGSLTGALSNDDLRDGFDADGDCQRTSETSLRFTGLVNGNNYSVVYAAIDESGNRGPNSPVAVGTPAGVQDFAEVYANSGGTERGGCAATDSNASAFWALLIALGAVRRRRIA